MDFAGKLFSLLRPSVWGGKQDKLNCALNEFNRSLTLIVDLEQLKDMVISALREFYPADTTAIFLLNLELNRFQLAVSRGIEGPLDYSRLSFSPEGPLIRWFTVNETHLILEEQPDIFAFFSEKEREVLEVTRTRTVFPLTSMNRLIGLVCLGALPHGAKPGPEELEFLRTLSGQAALALENAYLYQQQKARLKKMYRADRLATLGQLTAGAAHEIRNPLTSIRSTIQYLQKELEDPGKQELIGELIGEVDRINGIIEGLLSFSRPAKAEIQRVDLKLLLGQVFKLVSSTALKKDIRLDMEFIPQQTEFEADPALLKQVFLNIVMNSLESMEHGGRIMVRVELISARGAESKRDRRQFHLVFEDNGQGIPQEHLERVFDPFFTTKKEGTGLGLSISYGIIHQHGGDIEIESRTGESGSAGHGTRVAVTLPVKSPSPKKQDGQAKND